MPKRHWSLEIYRNPVTSIIAGEGRFVAVFTIRGYFIAAAWYQSGYGIKDSRLIRCPWNTPINVSEFLPNENH
jgi:hypothetical protein